MRRRRRRRLARSEEEEELKMERGVRLDRLLYSVDTTPFVGHSCLSKILIPF